MIYVEFEIDADNVLYFALASAGSSLLQSQTSFQSKSPFVSVQNEDALFRFQSSGVQIGMALCSQVRCVLRWVMCHGVTEPRSLICRRAHCNVIPLTSDEWPVLWSL